MRVCAPINCRYFSAARGTDACRRHLHPRLRRTPVLAVANGRFSHGFKACRRQRISTSSDDSSFYTDIGPLRRSLTRAHRDPGGTIAYVVDNGTRRWKLHLHFSIAILPIRRLREVSIALRTPCSKKASLFWRRRLIVSYAVLRKRHASRVREFHLSFTRASAR